tara:strand:+ start:8067 stop:8351 length:285 start_codon:yes stop_codon:yes gene_type:complete
MSKFTLIITTSNADLIKKIRWNADQIVQNSTAEFRIVLNVEYAPENIVPPRVNRTVPLGYLKNDLSLEEVAISSNSNSALEVLNAITIALETIE